MSMNSIQKKTTAKEKVIEMLVALHAFDDAVQIGNYSFAIPVQVEDEKFFVECSFVTKNNKATKTSPAFDPEVAQNKWLDAKEEADRIAAEKAEAKAKKKQKISESVSGKEVVEMLDSEE